MKRQARYYSDTQIYLFTLFRKYVVSVLIALPDLNPHSRRWQNHPSCVLSVASQPSPPPPHYYLVSRFFDWCFDIRYRTFQERIPDVNRGCYSICRPYTSRPLAMVTILEFKKCLLFMSVDSTKQIPPEHLTPRALSRVDANVLRSC